MKLSYFIFSLFVLPAILVSCGSTMKFEHSSVVPAASGKVKYKKDNNNNYAVTVKVTRLVKAKDLVPPRETYVVWMESEGTRLRNIGQISPSSGLFSKKLKAELKTTATSKPYDFFITAENDGHIQYPS